MSGHQNRPSFYTTTPSSVTKTYWGFPWCPYCMELERSWREVFFRFCQRNSDSNNILPTSGDSSHCNCCLHKAVILFLKIRPPSCSLVSWFKEGDLGCVGKSPKMFGAVAAFLEGHLREGHRAPTTERQGNGWGRRLALSWTWEQSLGQGPVAEPPHGKLYQSSLTA